MPPSPDAVPDDLILAALERAERHLRRQALPRSFVHDHLSIPSRSGEARRIKARIKALTEEGYLEQSRKNGVEVWSLTAKGRRRLKRANVAGLLPESPQHQAWRKATTLAAQEIERMRETLRTTLTEAVEQLEADAPSDMWFELSERLQRASRLVGSATHCLREWPEPSDDAPDIDDHTDTSDARLSPEQKARRKARRAGRRNVRLWGGKNS